MAKAPRKGLGRGLSALLGDDRPVIDVSEDAGGSNTIQGPPSGRRMMPVAFLERNEDQPRRHFDDEALADLTNSVKEKGVLQPLLVRSIGTDRYQIIAGERRWRAAQKAGIHDVPVIVRDMEDAEVLEVAIIENIQREDLSAIEEAIAFQRLMADFNHTQEGVAEVVGKSRSHVANLLRLLSLPEDVQKLVDQGALSMGHARALIGAENPAAVAKRVISEGLNVRQTEEAVRGLKGQGKTGNVRVRGSKPSGKDADTVALEKDLSAALAMKTTIAHEGEGGTVTIRYQDLEELDTLCSKLGVCGF
jgi:ParB family chromosome partitioning protein